MEVLTSRRCAGRASRKDIGQEIHDSMRTLRTMIAQDQRVVPVERRLDIEPAHARNGEDGLHHHRPGEDVGEGRAHVGDHRQQRALQHVPEDDRRLPQALGPGGADVSARSTSRHRSAGQAGDAGQVGQAEGRHRHDQHQPAAALAQPARSGQPGVPQRQEELHDRADHEQRHRDADDRDDMAA